MLTLAQLGRFLLDDNFSWEANFQRSPFIFEHEPLHDGNGSKLEDEFGIGDVKGIYNNIGRASHSRSLALSLRRIDPYWTSQLLVEYSKDIGACMILDDLVRDDRYAVDDMVIYSYGRIFLTRASSLKEKLLLVALEDFFSIHFEAYISLVVIGRVWAGLIPYFA